MHVTIQREYVVICDECEMASGESFPSARAARQWARANGWEKRGPDHLCSVCLEEAYVPG
jgi:hypothetical protein